MGRAAGELEFVAGQPPGDGDGAADGGDRASRPGEVAEARAELNGLPGGRGGLDAEDDARQEIARRGGPGVTVAARGKSIAAGGAGGKAFPDGRGARFEHGQVVAVDLLHDGLVQTELLQRFEQVECRKRRAEPDHARRRVEQVLFRMRQVRRLNDVVEDGQETGVLTGRRADAAVTPDAVGIGIFLGIPELVDAGDKPLAERLQPRCLRRVAEDGSFLERGIDRTDEEHAVVQHRLLILVGSGPVEHVPERPAEEALLVGVVLGALQITDD